MIPIKLTHLLGSIVGSSSLVFDPTKKSVVPPIPKHTFYKWEAQLAQCAYLSRLVYLPSTLFLRGALFLDYAPDVMNDVITQLEYSNYKKSSFESLFVSQSIPAEAKEIHGAFFPRTGCALFQHHNPASAINSQRTLYIVFKGSSSTRDFGNDLKFAKMNVGDIPQLAGLPGTTHYGFYNHMKDELASILASVKQLGIGTGMDRIVITGHSLGGAMATLFSFILAHQKEKGESMPQLHCVTFGAPNLFSDEARNSYNQLLIKGLLTLDRVTSNGDVVIGLPGVTFSHPGFNILKTELYPTAKTGRAVNIDDIRGVFLGEKMVGSNLLPSDPVFWNLFTPLESDAGVALKDRIADYGRPDTLKVIKRRKNQAFVAFVLGYIPTVGDMIPDPSPGEAEAEAADIAAETASLPTTSQSGGAIFATTAAASIYKNQSLQQYPNRINYSCYKFLSASFCHAAYMGIGFLSAIRAPKIGASGIVRKREPTQFTHFVGAGGALSPNVAYYALAAQRGGRTRHRRRPHRYTRRRTN
jgi:hypothetical protein